MRFAPVVALVVCACAAVPEKPTPSEPKIEYRTVSVPTPVPCFDESERPVAPEPTPIDLDHATPAQLAAALAADNAANELYMRAVEALFIKCQRAQGKEPK